MSLLSARQLKDGEQANVNEGTEGEAEPTFSSSYPERPPFWFSESDKYDYDLSLEPREGGYGKLCKVWARKSGRALAIKIYTNFNTTTEEKRRKEEADNQALILDTIRGGPHVLAAGLLRSAQDLKLCCVLPMDWYEYDLGQLMNDTKRGRGFIRSRGLIEMPPWYATVLTQMLEALVFLHSKKVMIVHRDINPKSIRYNTTDHFVLCHFRHAVTGQGPPGAHTGHPMFMPPELYDGEGQSTSADLWALGVTCLDMLNLLPLVQTDHCDFGDLRERQWCDTLCERIQHCGRPELALMVTRGVKRMPADSAPLIERAAAGEIVTFLENQPISKERCYQPSLGLLFLIFSEDREFKDWTTEDVHEFTAAYRLSLTLDVAKQAARRPERRRGGNISNQNGHARLGADSYPSEKKKRSTKELTLVTQVTRTSQNSSTVSQERSSQAARGGFGAKGQSSSPSRQQPSSSLRVAPPDRAPTESRGRAGPLQSVVQRPSADCSPGGLPKAWGRQINMFGLTAEQVKIVQQKGVQGFLQVIRGRIKMAELEATLEAMPEAKWEPPEPSSRTTRPTQQQSHPQPTSCSPPTQQQQLLLPPQPLSKRPDSSANSPPTKQSPRREVGSQHSSPIHSPRLHGRLPERSGGGRDIAAPSDRQGGPLTRKQPQLCNKVEPSSSITRPSPQELAPSTKIPRQCNTLTESPPTQIISEAVTTSSRDFGLLLGAKETPHQTHTIAIMPTGDTSRTADSQVLPPSSSLSSLRAGGGRAGQATLEAGPSHVGLPAGTQSLGHAVPEGFVLDLRGELFQALEAGISPGNDPGGAGEKGLSRTERRLRERQQQQQWGSGASSQAKASASGSNSQTQATGSTQVKQQQKQQNLGESMKAGKAGKKKKKK